MITKVFRRVIDGIVSEILRDVSGVDAHRYYTDKILSLTAENKDGKYALRIVQLDGELPKYPYNPEECETRPKYQTLLRQREGYIMARGDMLKAGYKKVIEEEK